MLDRSALAIYGWTIRRWTPLCPAVGRQKQSIYIQPTQLIRVHAAAPNSTWVPPAAWVSEVLSHLHRSVDVDSVSAYTELFQECVVLQPSLLTSPPAKAAETCWLLERFTRSSAVWFGPAVISDMLQQHTPSSMQQHLSGLMDLWLAHGQSPHSFGQLWLNAPAAMLQRGASDFRSHLVQLEALVPEVTPCDLLASSSSLAGFLLSLHDVGQQMQGHVHREVHGIIVLTHPSIHCVQLVQQQQQQQLLAGDDSASCEQGTTAAQQQGDRDTDERLQVVVVYGVVQDMSVQQQDGPSAARSSEATSTAGHPRAAPHVGRDSEDTSSSSSSTVNSSSSTAAEVTVGQQLQPPWEQQPDSKHTGGAYQQHLPSLSTPDQQSKSSSSPSRHSPSSSQPPLQALARIELWPRPKGAPPLPVLVLPPDT